MKLVLVEPDLEQRDGLVSMLRDIGVEVAAFADVRVALLFLLGRLEEVDGVMVNDDGGAGSSWLGRRLEMLSTAIPIVSFSARHPEREARICGAGPSMRFAPPFDAVPAGIER